LADELLPWRIWTEQAGSLLAWSGWQPDTRFSHVLPPQLTLGELPLARSLRRTLALDN